MSIQNVTCQYTVKWNDSGPPDSFFWVITSTISWEGRVCYINVYHWWCDIIFPWTNSVSKLKREDVILSRVLQDSTQCRRQGVQVDIVLLYILSLRLETENQFVYVDFHCADSIIVLRSKEFKVWALFSFYQSILQNYKAVSLRKIRKFFAIYLGNLKHFIFKQNSVLINSRYFKWNWGDCTTGIIPNCNI